MGPILFAAEVQETAGAGDKQTFSAGGRSIGMMLTYPVFVVLTQCLVLALYHSEYHMTYVTHLLCHVRADQSGR